MTRLQKSLNTHISCDILLLGSIIAILLIALSFRQFYTSFLISEEREIAVTEDCETTINRILAEEGTIQSYQQWSRYAAFTHAEQCSDKIAQL